MSPEAINKIAVFCMVLAAATVACGDVEFWKTSPDANDPGPSTDAQVSITPDAMDPADAQIQCTPESDTALCGCSPVVGIDTTTGSDTLATVGVSTKRAQSITVSQSAPLQTIRLVGGYRSTSGDQLISLTLYRETDPTQGPSGAYRLATESWTLSSTTFGNNGSSPRLPNDFDVSAWDVTLVPNETYWLFMTSSVNYLYMDMFTDIQDPIGDGYPGGRAQYFNGSQWSDQPHYDFVIEVNPCP